MARKRDGLVPIEEAISHLDGPVKKLRDATPQARCTTSPKLRSGEPACFGQRSGPGSRLHGAANGAVQSAPHQPRQAVSVCPPQRPLHAGDDCAGIDNKLPFGNLPRLIVGLGVHRSRADPKPER